MGHLAAARITLWPERRQLLRAVQAVVVAWAEEHLCWAALHTWAEMCLLRERRKLRNKKTTPEANWKQLPVVFSCFLKSIFFKRPSISSKRICSKKTWRVCYYDKPRSWPCKDVLVAFYKSACYWYLFWGTWFYVSRLRGGFQIFHASDLQAVDEQWRWRKTKTNWETNTTSIMDYHVYTVNFAPIRKLIPYSCSTIFSRWKTKQKQTLFTILQRKNKK